MEVSKITVKFGMTYNLGDYSNVRPEITLEAEGGDVCALHAQAVQYVHDAIDAELESAGRPPKYFSGPRFGLIKFADEKLVAILPQEVLDDGNHLRGAWRQGVGMRFIHMDHRLDTVSIEAVKLHKKHGYTIIDCSDGDLSQLPDIRNWLLVDSSNRHPDGIRYLVILPDGIKKDDLPGRWSSWYTNTHRISASLEGVLQVAGRSSDRPMQTILDLRDGNLSKLPPWPDDPQSEPDDDQGYEDDEDDDEEIF